jgi:hypothetical protein
LDAVISVGCPTPFLFLMPPPANARSQHTARNDDLHLNY